MTIPPGLAQCLATGHLWEWFGGIWLKCSRCEHMTPGNIRDE